MTVCPSCGTPHQDPAPRFCDGCGLALPRVRAPGAARDAAAAAVGIRCGECGMPATGRRCRNCGVPVKWPEDQIPPDEADAGTPPPPALELEDPTGGDDDLALEIDPGDETGGPGRRGPP